VPVVYATPTQVRAVLARDSTVPGGTAAELGDAPIQAAIDLAQADIDARLTARYTVPWAPPVPPIVVSLTVAIAAYHADLTHRQGQEVPATDPVVLRYKWAIDFLLLLASGVADIPSTEVTGAVLSGMTTVNPYSGAMFGLDDFDLANSNTPWVRGLPPARWS